jgi:ABC-2 type transport system ATP-binding protein
MATAQPAVDVKDLRKSFRTGHLRAVYRPVLKGLTFSVAAGEIFGYLGPNGAGKTTTLKILLGLLFADSGSVTILGTPHEARAWRYRVGFLPEHPYLYDYLTAAEYLDYAGRLFGIAPRARRDRARDLLRMVGLEGSADVPLRRFSKGMTQRVGLAQALVNDPDLVFLDEPMSGLDPLGRRLVRGLIMDLKRAGKTVFFSTHILGDAESLCDRVGLVRGGELAALGALDSILTVDVSHLDVLVAGVPEELVRALPVRAQSRVGERWSLEVDEGRLGEVVRAVESARGRVLSVQPIRQTLEEYFVQQVGEASGGGWD